MNAIPTTARALRRLPAALWHTLCLFHTLLLVCIAELEDEDHSDLT